MRQLIASLVLAASILGLAACSNGGGSNFVPTAQAANKGSSEHPVAGWPFG